MSTTTNVINNQTQTLAIDSFGAAGIVHTNSSGVIGSINDGSAGQLFVGTAGTPTWTTATYPSTVAKGDVLVASAANVVDIVAGATTAGYVLAANGATSAPSFQAGSGISLGTTQYALQVGSASGQLSSLSVGATGVILTGSTGANPGWTTATYPATVATGDILAATGTNAITAIAGTSAAAGYILTGNGSGVLPSWQALKGVITWNAPITSVTPVPMSVNNGYIVNLASTGIAILTLPATAAVGDVIKVTDISTFALGVAFRINHGAAGHSIIFSGVTGTTGLTGWMKSTSPQSTVELTCVVANTIWTVTAAVGSAFKLA
jgi:hypothetical protein